MDRNERKEAAKLVALMALVSIAGGALVSFSSMFMLVEFSVQALALLFAGLYVGKLRWELAPSALLGCAMGIAGAIAANSAEWVFSVHAEPLADTLGAFALNTLTASLFLAAAGAVVCIAGWSFRRKFLEDSVFNPPE